MPRGEQIPSARDGAVGGAAWLDRQGDRFLFRLAMALGMTVSRLESEASAREVRAWAEYDAEIPIGPERIDMAGAVVAWTMAEIHRDRKRAPRPARLSDFMPLSEVRRRRRGRRVGGMTEAEVRSVVQQTRAAVSLMGGAVRRAGVAGGGS